MASKRFITNRELKNKVTGIDIFVPDFEESSGFVTSSAVYNIIVITRLFYFKTHQHKESDVVQFMIQRKYEDFESLYHKLSERFPSVLFPSLSKRALIVNTSVLQDRKAVMNEVLQLVAKTQKLCCSPMFLQFLGVQAPQSKGHEKVAKPQEATVVQESSVIATEVGQVEAEDLFTAESGMNEKMVTANGRDGNDEETLLMEDPNQTISANFSTQSKLSIFENEETEHGEDELFINNKQMKDLILSKDTELEDDLDLLDVKDDVDDLLSLSRKSEVKQIVKAKPKPKPKPRPSLKGKSPEKAAFQTGTEDDETFARKTKEDEKELWKDGMEGEDEGDLFRKARRQSLRKQGAGEKSLDDIFSKNNSASLFGKSEEADLFSQKPESTKQQNIHSMDESDIMKYITENSSDP